MLISKDVIDASIKTKNALREAKDSAVLGQIIQEIPALTSMTTNMNDILETLNYLCSTDKDTATQFKDDIFKLDGTFRLDMCNAIDYLGKKKWGIRVSYDVDCEEFHHRLYVCDSVVLFGVGLSEELRIVTEGNIRAYLPPKDYDRFYKSVIHLILEIPEYSKRLSYNLGLYLSNIK